MILIGVSAAALMFAFCWWQMRSGMREEYWEPMESIHARMWENLVWAHTTWQNHRPDGSLETPDEGIERLAGPWKNKK